MKHIFKKLHFGGSSHDPSRTGDTSPSPSPSAASAAAAPSMSAAPPALSCGSDHRRAMLPAPAPPPAATEGGGAAAASAAAEDYFLTEEEFQMQLAMAISASNTEFGDDPHNDQIRAATLLSLGRHRDDPAREEEGAAESLARRYWDYNVLDYDDKVVDGFYDIFELSADPSKCGKMPSLADLQSNIGDLGFEVIIVNRAIDRSLLELEQVAQCISLDRPAGKTALLVERIAELVTDNMGGPVRDANDMLARWMERSSMLRTSLQTSLMPIGGVNIGLSRHRALLFKVLADKVGIPCKLVKGSHYTGIDGDALNIVKLGNEREYLVDLMAAPGTLIPADVLSSRETSFSLQNPHLYENPASSVETDCNWVEVDSPISPEPEQSKGEHGGLGKLGAERPGTRQGKPRPGKVDDSEVSSSNLLQLNAGGSFSGEENSSFLDDHSNRLLTAKYTTSDDKEVIDLPMHIEGEKSQTDGHLQDIKDSNELFADLNPFQAIWGRQAASNFKHTEKGLNGFHRRRENLSPGPGRPPLPLVWKNRSTCNELSSNKHNEVVDGGFPKKNIIANDQNLSSSNLTSSSASHGKLHHENSKNNAAWTSGFPYIHAVEASNTQVADILTEDSVSGAISSVEINAASRVNQSGPGVVTNDGTQAEHSLLYFNSSEKTLEDADVTREYRLPTGTTYEQEYDKHVKDKYDGRRWTHDRSMVTDASTSYAPPTLTRGDKLDPVLDDVAGLEISWEDLVIGERIGLGSYGEVYRADWNGTEVAVKKFLDQDFYGDALDEFLSEVRIMRRLRHPNVVLFMGAVTRHPNLSIVTEFLPRGSLYRILHRPNCQIDQKRRIKMALDVAKGMNCLHASTPTIVHRDLKSPNLLVDKNWNVKVCDFGLSRLKHNTFLSSKSTAGTPEWMAPEVLRNEQSNEKCDVYSFGVILWELATLRMPWSGMNPMQVVGAVGFQNRRLEIPKEVDPLVARIIRECWQQDPSLRPSFSQLTATLKPLQRLVVPSQPDLQEISVNSTP